jgi:hypothetical protein
VGYTTDCRRNEDKTNEDLCVKLESKHPNEPYSAACDEACLLWNDSGCLETVGFPSIDECRALCMVSNPKLGWGWNYVDCLESVVRDIQQVGNSDNCGMMTEMCRNIFGNNSVVSGLPHNFDFSSIRSTLPPVLVDHAAVGLLLPLLWSMGLLLLLFAYLVRRHERAVKQVKLDGIEEAEMEELYSNLEKF